MAVEFRCEKCGKLLSVEAEPGAKVKCQYCNAKVAIPAGLASLPRPQVPTSAAPPPMPEQPQAGEGQGEEEQLAPGRDTLMDVMAMIMPWVISLFFHAGIMVILAFVTIVMYSKTGEAAAPIIPDAELSKQPGARLDPSQSDRKLESRSMAERRHDWAVRNTRLDQGQTDEPVVIANPGGSSGSAGEWGLVGGGSGKGPRAGFIGLGGNCYHIVLVVDRSGSMLDYFDLVRREMDKTVMMLQPEQTFHVILFARGEADENPPRSLVYASPANKAQAYKYLKTIRAGGGSPTNPLVAIKRAFDVLAHPPNKKRGKLMFLLTDGEFHDNQEVRKKIAGWNKRKDVFINTILYATGGEDIRRVLKQIAEENGGRFKFEDYNE